MPACEVKGHLGAGLVEDDNLLHIAGFQHGGAELLPAVGLNITKIRYVTSS
jgi:hypothetical protein